MRVSVTELPRNLWILAEYAGLPKNRRQWRPQSFLIQRMLSNMSRNPSQSSLQTLPSPSNRNVPRCRLFMLGSLFCGNLAAKESIERNLRESSPFTKPFPIRSVTPQN